MDEQQKTPEQLLLNWPVNEKFAQSNFLPAASNKKAVKWIDSWPNWQRGEEQFHCLIIYGPDGCGKTHLAHVWQKMSKAKIIAGDDLGKSDFISGDQLVFIVEDVEPCSAKLSSANNFVNNPGTQEALLHLFNWTKEQGGYILLTARERPKKWLISLEDLSSRLLASEASKIELPDDDLLKDIMIKQFSDRQITLSKDVIKYLITRTERSFDAVRNLVKDIDNLSMSEKKKITIPVVKRVLENRVEG